jgi:6-phosphogluconolactonase (cycloisomerase 2 family)
VFRLRRCTRAAGLVFAVCLLVPVTASATTATATSVIVSPDGSVVYAGFNGVGFSVFSRDPTTGKLSVLGEAPEAPTGGGLFNPSLAVSPDGANVYGVDGQGNQLLQYARVGGGVATQQAYPVLADLTLAKDPITLTVSPDGSSVYVLSYGVQYGSGIGVASDGKINAFERDSSTGNLALVQTTSLDTSSNFGGAVGIDPVISPDGKFIYVTSPSVSGGVYVLSRNTTTGAVAVQERDGNLNGGNAIAISPDGNYVYETGPPSPSSSASSAISVLSRNASTGQLTPVSQIQNGAGGVSGLNDMWGVAVSPDGRCLYATSRADNSLGYFTRNPSSGTLTFDGILSEGSGGVTGMGNARRVTVSADGNNVYVASPSDNGVAVFSRNSTTCAPTFLELAQDLFTLGQPSVDSTQGTAKLPVSVDTGGALDVSVTPVTAQGSMRPTAGDPQVIQVSQAGVVNVPISLDSQQAQELDTLHQLSVKTTTTFTASGGTPTTKAVVIRLIKTRGSVSKLHLSPSRFSLSGREVRGRCVAATRHNDTRKRCLRSMKLRVSYRLNVPDAVTFTIKVQVSGRRAGRRCVKPTSKNRGHRKCTRLVDLRGQFVRTGNAGANQFTWGGVIGGHRLGLGTYVLVATPLGGTGKHGNFTILP